MRGRTNVGGGGNDVFIDGNLIEGIVADASGIVSGDFVQKNISSSKIYPSLNASISDEKYIISDVFILSDGSFCMFFSTEQGTLYEKLYLWKYKIEDDEMIDLGVTKVPDENLPLGNTYNRTMFVKSGTDEFLFSYFEAIPKPTDSGDTYNSAKINFVKISIADGVITTQLIGANEIDTYPYNVKNLIVSDLTKGTPYLKKLRGNSYGLFIRLDCRKIGEYNDILKNFLFVFNLNENGEMIFSNTIEGYYTNEILPYNDSNYFISFVEGSDGTFSLFEYGEGTLTFIKSNDANFTKPKNGCIYIGDNQTLIIQKVNIVSSGFDIIAKKLTYSPNAFSLSGEIVIGSVQSVIGIGHSHSYNSFDFNFFNSSENVFLYFAWNSYYQQTNPNGTTSLRYGEKIGISLFDISTLKSNGFVVLRDYDSTSQYSMKCNCFGAAEHLGKVSLASYIRSDNHVPFSYGLKISEGFLESLEEFVKFTKYYYKIDGVAKQSGNQGDIIEVYVPKQ